MIIIMWFVVVSLDDVDDDDWVVEGVVNAGCTRVRGDRRRLRRHWLARWLLRCVREILYKLYAHPIANRSIPVRMRLDWLRLAFVGRVYRMRHLRVTHVAVLGRCKFMNL